MASAEPTTNHEEIRSWAEERGGRPASVKATHHQRSETDAGILRIDFGEKEDSLDEITWDEWFETFDKAQLAFLHQDETADGKPSRFFKLVRRS
jgi:hypothetical protein